MTPTQAILILIIITTYQIAFSQECTNSYQGCCYALNYNLTTNTTATAIFNLCPLQLDENSAIPYYQVTDNTYSGDDISYRFSYNFGGALLDYPSETCKNHQGKYCPLNEFDNKGYCKQPPNLVLHDFPVLTWGYMELINDTTQETIECWDLAGTEESIFASFATHKITPLPGDWSLTYGVHVNYREGDYYPKYMRNRGIVLIISCTNEYHGNGVLSSEIVYQSKDFAEWVCYILYFVYIDH